MDDLETGKDKIKKICEILKNESLQPAKEEAQQIVEVAQEEARQIIRDAEKKAADTLKKTYEKIGQEKQLFESSLEQACRQGVESLRQDIENNLFNESLSQLLKKETSSPEIVAKLIKTLINAIEKEGSSADFSAIIPKQTTPDQVNAILGKQILERLREKEVIVGSFVGGAQLKLHDQQLTLDLSDDALRELISNFIRKDFRKFLFKT